MAYLVFFISYFFYVVTLTPTIFWRDSPEFQDIIHTLGISHPAGSPLYVMLGKMVALLPIGDLYFRGNLLSAIYAALSVTVLFLILTKIIKLDRWLSFFLALFLAFSYPLWQNGSAAEVYSMNLFFLTILTYVILKYTERREIKYVLLGSLIYGLSSGVHAAVALYLPAFTWIYFTYTDRNKFRLIPAVAALFLIGFSVYLFLPLRAIHWPQFNWGNPQDITGIIAQFTDAKDKGDRVGVLAATHSEVLDYIKAFFTNINIDLTPIVPVLALLGLITLFKNNYKLAIFYILLAIPNLFFFISWKVGTPLLPTYLVIMLLAGYFLKFLSDNFLDEKRKILSTVVLASGVFFLGFYTFPRVDKHDYWCGRSFFLPDFVFAPANSLMISDSSWFIMRALQDIERSRDDLKIISPGMIFMDDYFSPIDSHRFPGVTDYPNIIDDFVRFKKVILTNLKKMPVLIESDDSINPNILFCCAIKPGEKFYQEYKLYYSLTGTELTEYGRRVLNYLEIDAENGLSRFSDESPFVGSVIDGLGIFFSHFGRTHFMIRALELLGKWYPSQFKKKNFYVNLGIAYFLSNNPDKAVFYLKKALPDPKAFYNLGVIYYTREKYTQAYRYLSRITILSHPDASNGYLFLYLGKSLYQLGRYKEAKKYLNLAREYYLTEGIPAEATKILTCIKEGKKDCK